MILCALLAAGLLAGCGGSDEEEPAAQNTPKAEATEAPEEQQSSGDAEAEIRETFDSYNAALADRDFGKACDGLSPDTTAKLRENVKKLGVSNPPEDCDELLSTVYETIDKDPEQKKLIDEIAKSAEIDKITVKGEEATIEWHATANGQKTPISQTARLVDGEWKLVDVTN
jgi:hypothetical protein